jgi:D-alanine-D-alanine ligase
MFGEMRVFFSSAGFVYFFVNPNPGWCWDGHLARMAEFAGVDYRTMLRDILKACEDRLNAGRVVGARKPAH